MSHNLKFSTHPDPQKCKTKTMAFLKKSRPLPNLLLCGNPLPWTTKCKHLGINLEDRINGCEFDMRVKNAKYIDKNIELNQEFHFAHPATKVQLNKIYNTHYSGSPVWNLFGPGAHTIESSYNRSVKVMLDLPFATHRSLIQPLTGDLHIKIVLIRRFIGFIEKIKDCGKVALKMLMTEAAKDVRSVTGSNLRNIMLLVDKNRVEDVKLDDLNKVTYFKLEENERWKISMIKEVVDTKAGQLEVPGFEHEELEALLKHLCTD